jgi:hypothetical protein
MFDNFTTKGTQRMSIYSQFITPSQLTSPVNDYTCKRITKQNIKQFGFESIEELHITFPDFPLMCEEFHEKVKSGKDSKKHKDHFDKVRAENREMRDKLLAEEKKMYSLSPKRCAKCNEVIPFDKRSWNHCSRACSNSRQWNKDDKIKKSVSAKRFFEENKKEKTKKIIQKKTEKKVEVSCIGCNTSLHLSLKVYQKRQIKLFTCNENSCKSTYIKEVSRESGKRSANKRNKRSKKEIELYDLLKLNFSNIGNNETIANGWDADILLHDHKIAILWNGPWHYREMGFSNHSLKQVVNRDCIKIQEFESIGWNVLIYEDRHWTPIEALIDVLLKIGGPGRT